MSADCAIVRSRAIRVVAALCFGFFVAVPGSGYASEATATGTLSLSDRPRIGVVLSGGGARGLAHVGVLKVLEELRIPIDCIAGTSMGALVAGAYAAGVSPQTMIDKVSQVDWGYIFNDDPARIEMPFREKRDREFSYFNMEVGWHRGRVLTPPGTTSGYKFELFIRELLGPASGDHALKFDDLPIPYRAVATDLENGTEKVFDRGDLARVMRASMSVPGVIAPVDINGKLYVDGGLVNNLPIDTVRAMCADVVIAVNLGTPLKSRAELASVFAVSEQSVNLLTELNVKRSLATLGDRDILITPALDEIGSGDFVNALNAVPSGVQATRDIAAYLGGFSLDETTYAAWRQQRMARRAPAPLVNEFRFSETQRVTPEVLVPELDLRTGLAFDQVRLHDRLIRLYGRGDFERVGYHIEDSDEGRSIVLEPVEKSWGPEYLKFGIGIAGDFDASTLVGMSASHRRTWLNSRGAEWRTDVVLGSIKRLSTEYFQPSSARRGSAFFAARAAYESQAEIIYLEGRRFGEYDVTSTRAFFEIGTQDKYGELRLGVFAGWLEAAEDFGILSFIPDYDLDQAGITVSAIYDQLDNIDFPRHGAAIGGHLFSTRADMGSDDDYDKVELTWQWARTHGAHTLVPAVLFADNVGSELPPYDLIQLGGFLRLSGYRIDELTGADYALARLVYYYRYASLPPQLGGGVYLGGSAEVGRIRDGLDQSISNKPQFAGSAFVGADTVLGPLWFAVGHAERGHTAVYVLLGRLVPL